MSLPYPACPLYGPADRSGSGDADAPFAGWALLVDDGQSPKTSRVSSHALTTSQLGGEGNLECATLRVERKYIKVVSAKDLKITDPQGKPLRLLTLDKPAVLPPGCVCCRICHRKLGDGTVPLLEYPGSEARAKYEKKDGAVSQLPGCSWLASVHGKHAVIRGLRLDGSRKLFGRTDLRDLSADLESSTPCNCDAEAEATGLPPLAGGGRNLPATASSRAPHLNDTLRPRPPAAKGDKAPLPRFNAPVPTAAAAKAQSTDGSSSREAHPRGTSSSPPSTCGASDGDAHDDVERERSEPAAAGVARQIQPRSKSSTAIPSWSARAAEGTSAADAAPSAEAQFGAGAASASANQGEAQTSGITGGSLSSFTSLLQSRRGDYVIAGFLFGGILYAAGQLVGSADGGGGAFGGGASGGAGGGAYVTGGGGGGVGPGQQVVVNVNIPRSSLH